MGNSALGKGLSALIPETPKENKAEGVLMVSAELIELNSMQPRTNYDMEKLNELIASIKEKGVLQPILVREKGKGFEVIAGERRLRAARALKLEEIPVIVKNVDDQQALEIALVENIQREELNPIEEAQAYNRLMDEFGYTHEQIAVAVGKDRSTITNLLRLLKLPQTIQNSVYSGDLSVGHARALLSAGTSFDMIRLLEVTIKKGLSVRELEHLVKSKSASTSPRRKQKSAKDHDIVRLEEDLQKSLGTKVEVINHKKRGKIVIEYYSLDDLQRIIQTITQ